MTNVALNRITVFPQDGNKPEFIFTPHFEGDTAESVSKELSEQLLGIGDRFALFGQVDISCELPFSEIIFQQISTTDNKPGKPEVQIVLIAAFKVKFFLPREGSVTAIGDKPKISHGKFTNLAEQKLCLELLHSSSTKEEHLNPVLRKKSDSSKEKT